jgi:hypothetical protein
MFSSSKILLKTERLFRLFLLYAVTIDKRAGAKAQDENLLLVAWRLMPRKVPSFQNQLHALKRAESARERPLPIFPLVIFLRRSSGDELHTLRDNISAGVLHEHVDVVGC